jgi:hypothetical protein
MTENIISEKIPRNIKVQIVSKTKAILFACFSYFSKYGVCETRDIISLPAS